MPVRRSQTDVDEYRAEVGDDKARRQLAVEEGRCYWCWTPAGEPHTGLCPDADAEPDTAAQNESLF